MRIPGATYRLQFTPNFKFSDAVQILDYLSDLGITHIYASPILKSRTSSSHGYDMVDPEIINDELGGIEAFENLAKEVKKRGLFWLQDIVPNHMAFDPENQMLMSIFENGMNSPYFNYFDIDWKHIYSSMKERVLAPFLGKFYSECLESGEIQLKYDENGFSINYYSLRFPLRIESYTAILERNVDVFEQRLSKDNFEFVKYYGNINLIKNGSLKGDISVRNDQVRHFKKMVWDLYNESEHVRQFMDENIAVFNGILGNPESFNELDKLLSEQYYRLSFWKVAAEEINYRRFFTVNDLISMRVENEEVFEKMHRVIFEQISKGNIHGLRVDHIDGLFDPEKYLKELREKNKDVYVIAEKILDRGESLPEEWQLNGTTGYDFLNYMNGLFCDISNQKAFTVLYGKFIGSNPQYDEIVFNKKRLIIGKHMAGNIDNLAQSLKNISGSDRYGVDITLYGLKRAFVDVMALFPVYRTYITSERYSEQDRNYIKEAIGLAKRKNPGLTYELNFIEKFLLLNFSENVESAEKEKAIRFIMNFQQYTGPIMAKGLEDTVFYIYNRLLSLNEVGANPIKFGVSKEEFNKYILAREKNWKHSMNASSTHDTKRGEDVRARLNVLSEIPNEFSMKIKSWAKYNKRNKTTVNANTAPDRNDEFLIYQTLIGTYPFDREEGYLERIKQYTVKAIRESKEHTAWIKPDTEYEEACTVFVEKILLDSTDNIFLSELREFQQKTADLGLVNSLSQVMIKTTCPGVPDFYQGTELWDLSLVDPDNRRPVNYNLRNKYIEDIKIKTDSGIKELLKDLILNRADGRIKLFLIYKLLNYRKNNQAIFDFGSYVPLPVSGTKSNSILAFARKHENDWLVCIVPRLGFLVAKEFEGMMNCDNWTDTQIKIPMEAPSQWNNIITGSSFESTGGMLNVNVVLSEFPVALISSAKVS